MIYNLYGGDVQLIFDPDAHEYLYNNKFSTPGATAITGMVNKPNLVKWAAKEAAEEIRNTLVPGVPLDEMDILRLIDRAKTKHEKISKQSTTFGTAVHSWLERHVEAQIHGTKLPKLPVNPDIRWTVEAYLNWEKENNPEYFFSERKVFSKSLLVGGTADVGMVLDSQKILMDFKTSKHIYPEYFIQGAGYAKMYEEETGEAFDRVLIMRVPKQQSGKKVRQKVSFKFNDHKTINRTIEELWWGFRGLLAVWRLLENRDMKTGEPR